MDWEIVIIIGVMLMLEIVNLCINIGQLYIIEGQYDQGINMFEVVICDVGLDIVIVLLVCMLFQVYVQVECY